MHQFLEEEKTHKKQARINNECMLNPSSMWIASAC